DARKSGYRFSVRRGNRKRLRRQRVPRHQVVWMRPAGERLDALTPGGDRRMLLADVEAELLRRIIEVPCKRHVRDGGPLAEQESAALQPFVDDAEIAVDATLEKGEHGRIARGLGEVLQETIGPEKAIDLLIVENDPAQCFQLFVLALGQVFAGAAREIGEDHARLGE